MPSRKGLKSVVAENVARLRSARKISQPGIAAAAKRVGLSIDQTTVGRIERGAHAADVESLEAVARGLGVAPWQLLIPDLKPEALPELGDQNISKDEQQLLKDYRTATDAWKLTLRLMARTQPDDQLELSKDMNILMTTIFDQAVPDERLGGNWTRPDRVHQPEATYKPKK